jgi:phosphate transport system permease protein
MRSNVKHQIIKNIFRFASYAVIAVLVLIIGFIFVKGIDVISIGFIFDYPTDGMTSGGIFPAIIGTLCLMFGSALISFPVGIMAGIYMNEYANNGKVIRFIRLMTNNLSGIPSVVFGLFGMALFVNQLGFGDSILAGSLTLSILALPIIIRTTEEALKSVDNLYREASYALGASKVYTIQKVVLPIAMPSITTGMILSMSRVSGETAPILFTVAAYFLPHLPISIFDQVMALPYHLYVIATSGTNIEKSLPIAYGTAIVLIFIVLCCNLLANFIRNKYSNKQHTTGLKQVNRIISKYFEDYF